MYFFVSLIRKQNFIFFELRMTVFFLIKGLNETRDLSVFLGNKALGGIAFAWFANHKGKSEIIFLLYLERIPEAKSFIRR